MGGSHKERWSVTLFAFETDQTLSGVSPTKRWNQTPTGASQSHTSGMGIAGENSPSISQRKSGSLETPISTLSQQQEFSAFLFLFFFSSFLEASRL
jgi:hypothetical protein